MPRVKGGVLGRLGGRSGDRGAVAVIVAVLLAGGVLLGAAALAVDVGRLYAEREELQSGADAAAVAIALDCGTNRWWECGTAAATNTGRGYANHNAKDGASRVTLVCGNDGFGRLQPCTGPQPSNLSACLTPRPTNGTRYVEVHTATETADHETILPSVFAQTLAGGTEGTEVGACARTAWGTPSGGLAITISLCEWLGATSGGFNYAPAPPATPNASYERDIHFHDVNRNDPCPAGPPGWDAPGGFGWVDDGATSDCQVDIVNNQYGPKTGGGAPQPCRGVLEDARDNHTVVLIPIYDDVTGNGNNARYHLFGVAAFVVTGYKFPGFAERSNLTNRHLCTGQEQCLYGYFVSAVVPWTGSPGNNPYLGALAVKTVG